MMEIQTKWITQKEAAEIMGKSLQSICQLVRLNRIRSKRKFGKRLVHYKDVLNYAPIKLGRPKKNES